MGFPLQNLVKVIVPEDPKVAVQLGKFAKILQKLLPLKNFPICAGRISSEESQDHLLSGHLAYSRLDCVRFKVSEREEQQ